MAKQKAKIYLKVLNYLRVVFIAKKTCLRILPVKRGEDATGESVFR